MIVDDPGSVPQVVNTASAQSDQISSVNDNAIDIVNNAAPIPDAGGPYAFAEGESVILDGSGSIDPDGDPMSYSWDLDNNGSYGDVTGISPLVTWATLASYGLDDDGPYTIGLEVEDLIAGATDTAAVSISNTTPSITTSGSATSVGGSPFTLNLGVTDPGDDTVSQWIIDWGDGTTQAIAGNPASVNHTYPSTARHYDILAAVTDEDDTHLQNDLVVTGYLGDTTIRYRAPDGSNPTSLQTGFGMVRPYDVAISPTGDYYVSSYGTDQIFRLIRPGFRGGSQLLNEDGSYEDGCEEQADDAVVLAGAEGAGGADGVRAA